MKNLILEFQKIPKHRLAIIIVSTVLLFLLSIALLAFLVLVPREVLEYHANYKDQTTWLSWNNSCDLATYEIAELPGFSFKYRPCDWDRINFAQGKESNNTIISLNECALWGDASCVGDGIEMAIYYPVREEPFWGNCFAEEVMELENGWFASQSPNFVAIDSEDIILNFAQRYSNDTSEVPEDLIRGLKCSYMGVSPVISGSVFGESDTDYYLSISYWGKNPNLANQVVGSIILP